MTKELGSKCSRFLALNRGRQETVMYKLQVFGVHIKEGNCVEAASLNETRHAVKGLTVLYQDWLH